MSNESSTVPNCHQQSQSTLVSALTFDDSWQAAETGKGYSCILAPPASYKNSHATELRRGRRSAIMMQKHEDGNFLVNRFASTTQPRLLLEEQQQQSPSPSHPTNLGDPLPRRPSSGSATAATNSSSDDDNLSLDLTSAYKSFNDSDFITVSTELLEKDFDATEAIVLPAVTSRPQTTGMNRRSYTGSSKLSTRPSLTTTWEEFPEKSERTLSPSKTQNNQCHQINPLSSSSSPPLPPPPPLTFTPSPPLSSLPTTSFSTPNTSNSRKFHKQDFRRESITLETALIQTTLARNNWGVKSSLTLDSALFDDLPLMEVNVEDDFPSKRTSWAVGSSLTLGTFGDDDSSSLFMLTARDELIAPTMNSLRFSSSQHGDNSTTTYYIGNEQRSVPSTFSSSITPCSKPIRTNSTAAEPPLSKESTLSDVSPPRRRSNHFHSHSPSQCPVVPIRQRSGFSDHSKTNSQLACFRQGSFGSHLSDAPLQPTRRASVESLPMA